MGLEQFLTTSDKIASLEKLTSLLAADIYFSCLKYGIEPDGFDYAAFEAPSDGPDVFSPHLRDLEIKCKSLAAAEQKLAELNNA